MPAFHPFPVTSYTRPNLRESAGINKHRERGASSTYRQVPLLGLLSGHGGGAGGLEGGGGGGHPTPPAP